MLTALEKIHLVHTLPAQFACYFPRACVQLLRFSGALAVYRMQHGGRPKENVFIPVLSLLYMSRLIRCRPVSSSRLIGEVGNTTRWDMNLGLPMFAFKR